MKRKMITSYLCVLTLATSPVVAFAADPSTGIDGAAAAAAAAANNAPSVNQSANNSASSNSSGQIMSYLTGAMMFTMAAQKYGECSSDNYGACAMAAIYTGMGVMSMAQGSAHGSAADGANFTGMSTDGMSGDPYASGNYNPSNPNNPLNSDPSFAAMGANMAKLSSGDGTSTMKLNTAAGTITTPDGKTYQTSDFSSAASMAAAGLPQSAIDSAMGAYAQVEKKAEAKLDKLGLAATKGAMTAASGYEDGGGSGGGSGGASSDAGGASGRGVASAGRLGLGLNNKDGSSVAGMSKNYNGEPIGVAADSIFLMMTRRYKVKQSQQSFFGDGDLSLQK